MNERPPWLRKKIKWEDLHKMKSILRGLNLHTVCEESLCPNLSECFGRGIATFLILGNICTRRCAFCGVKKGKPLPLDKDEPERVAKAVKLLNLSFVVITSVTRDDLPDGGAEHFVNTVEKIKKFSPSTKVEVLVPDFGGNIESIKKVVNSDISIFSHDVDIVPRLYKELRRSNYKRSLKVLLKAKELNPDLFTKSDLILGLGEKKEEVVDVLKDLREVGCDFLTMGQYLSPSKSHYPVKRFVPPQEFEELMEIAKEMGFLKVKSGPYVRSSYMAEDFLQ